ncbi:hypothetical protein Tco_0385756 [Tanacetum coccineum]
MDWGKLIQLHGLGEVNPTHTYYNGSSTSKDTEDPSWSTSLKTRRRTQKTSLALEALWKTDFKKFFKRRGRFVRQSRDERKSFQRSKDDKNGKRKRKYFRCGDPNHLIEECLKPPRNKNQRAFVGGTWSDSAKDEEEKTKD